MAESGERPEDLNPDPRIEAQREKEKHPRWESPKSKLEPPERRVIFNPLKTPDISSNFPKTRDVTKTIPLKRRQRI